MGLGGSFHECWFTSVDVGGNNFRWNFHGSKFSAQFTAIEVGKLCGIDLLPCKWVGVSKQVDGNFNGSERKNPTVWMTGYAQHNEQFRGLRTAGVCRTLLVCVRGAAGCFRGSFGARAYSSTPIPDTEPDVQRWWKPKPMNKSHKAYY